MATAQVTKDVEAELLRLEDERARAAMTGDAATLERLVSDDLVYTHSTGRLDTKRSFIESTKSGAVKYRRMERKDTKVTVRDGFAFLTGGIEIDVETGGRTLNLNLRFSNVWERSGGSWRQILWQTTPIPPKA